MISVKNLNKGYNRKTVLSDISFDVQNGTIVGLLGINGAGKTTLLKCIAGIIPSDNGEIIIDDEKLSKENITSIHKKIGILFGTDVGLYGKLTVYENLRYFAELQGISKKCIDSIIVDLSEKFLFFNYLHQKANTLSKGMTQKTVLARAIIHSPQNIILDEPESGLDYKAVEIVKDFILEQKNSGKAVLFSSHSLGLINDISDVIILIEDGKLKRMR